MPRDKPDPAARKPSRYEGAGSAAVNAMVDRVAPAILQLLGDGVPRSKPAIVEALAGRHDKQDVVHALIRLAVTGRVVETGGKYTPAASEPSPGAPRRSWWGVTTGRARRPAPPASAAAARPRPSPAPRPRPGGRGPAAAPRRSR